jgi:hypothetical protein
MVPQIVDVTLRVGSEPVLQTPAPQGPQPPERPVKRVSAFSNSLLFIVVVLVGDSAP